jgi:hypothetical protein
MARTYAEMASDKTPLDVRAAGCVNHDACCAPTSFWFLLEQILLLQDWKRISGCLRQLLMAHFRLLVTSATSDYQMAMTPTTEGLLERSNLLEEC